MTDGQELHANGSLANGTRRSDALANDSPSAATRLPVPNSTVSYWQTELHELANHRTTAELPKDCDVLIIGSGYAGTSTAYNLAKSENPDIQSIVVLEARQTCSGATGRNGGHVRPDLYGTVSTYIDRFGVEAGREWAEFEISHLQAIKNLVETEGIDCDFTMSRCTDAWANESAASKAKARYDKMAALDLPHMNDMQFTYGPKAAGISGVKNARACSTFTTGSMFPYKFVSALMARALASGNVNLQTTTPATSVQCDPAGGFVVETPRGSIRAKKVIHANNAYVSGLLPEYAKNIVPCKGICVHIGVPEAKPAPHLSKSYILWDVDNVSSYLIPRHDGGIIVGGSAALFESHREQWYNNIDDSTLIDASEGYYDGFMQRMFHGWEDSGARVTKAWTGVMGYTFDSLPQIGEVPGKPGQYIIAGFNGHGMPLIWLFAKGVAEMVAKGKSYEETGLPRIAKTSTERIREAQEGPEGGDILASTKGKLNEQVDAPKIADGANVLT